MDDKELRRLKRFEDWQHDSIGSKNYAIERFDLLIIAISTTGVIIDLNLIKSALELNLDLSFWYHITIKLSALFFSLSIIFNFISQLSAHKAYKQEELWAQQSVWMMEENESYDMEKRNTLREKANKGHKKTTKMNKLSTITLTIGFLLLAVVITFFG